MINWDAIEWSTIIANSIVIITFLVPIFIYIFKNFKKNKDILTETDKIKNLVIEENKKIAELVKLERQKHDLLVHNKVLIKNIALDIDLILEYDDYTENRLHLVFENCEILNQNYHEQLTNNQINILEQLLNYCSPTNYNVGNKLLIVELLYKFKSSFSLISDSRWGGNSNE